MDEDNANTLCRCPLYRTHYLSVSGTASVILATSVRLTEDFHPNASLSVGELDLTKHEPARALIEGRDTAYQIARLVFHSLSLITRWLLPLK